MTRPTMPRACPACAADLTTGDPDLTQAQGVDYPSGWGWPRRWCCPACGHFWPAS